MGLGGLSGELGGWPMTPLDYIRVDADILGLDLSSTEKLLLGLVKNFNSRGLMLSNAEIGRLLNAKADTTSKAISRLKSKNLIYFDKKQSRYRRIYFGKISDVKSNSTSDVFPATSDLIPSTSEKNPTIIIENTRKRCAEGNAKKINSELKVAFDSARKLYPGRKRGLDIELDEFKKAVKDWRDVLPKLEPSIQAYVAHCKHLTDTGQFCPHHKDFCRWLKNRCWETEYPDPLSGVTREADETEIDALLGAKKQ